MPPIDQVRAWNATLHTFPAEMVLVFVGATSGIGESTLKQFCRNVVKPRIYFVGRNQKAANRIIAKIKVLQPETEPTFIKKDLTLLKNVDEVCNEIMAKETTINLLFMSHGRLQEERRETSEGVDHELALEYYSRIRFINQLLPLLRTGHPALSRIVSVLAPGPKPPHFDPEDLDLTHDPSNRKLPMHIRVMSELTFEKLAEANNKVTFIIAYSDLVKTGWFKDYDFVRRTLPYLRMKTGLWPTTPLIESGERLLYTATHVCYTAEARAAEHREAELKEANLRQANLASVADDHDLIISRIGSDGSDYSCTGPENLSTPWIGQASADSSATNRLIADLREMGMGPRIWKHTMAKFDSVLSR